MPAAPTLTDLATAQKNSYLLGNNQGEEQRLLDRKRAAYALKSAEREAFLRYCDENDSFDVVLRAANGAEFPLRPSTEAINAIYSAIHEDLTQALREREAIIIGELLRMEEDAAVYASRPQGKQERKADTYESAILGLCMPAETSATTPISESLPAASLPLPAGQRLFVTPPTRPAALTV